VTSERSDNVHVWILLNVLETFVGNVQENVL